MHIGPSADQLNLRDAVREVLAAECPLTLNRQTQTNHQAWQPLWKTTVALGWAGLARRGLADDDLGLNTLDLVLALEACGSVLAPAPFVSSVGLAAGAARAGGVAMADVLTEIAGGSVATLAAQSAGARLPSGPMMLHNNHVRGSAVVVPDAEHAELFVVLCADGDTTSVAAVRRGPGVTVVPTDSVDPSRPLATLAVDTRPEIATSVRLDAALSPAVLAIAAELVGVAQGALDRAADHARSRTQFGRPIGAYQGVKHALADNRVAVERARSLTYLAAARLDDPDAALDDVWSSCALAKAAAGDAALQCTRSAVQVFGAIGQTWEHDAHLFLRRAWVGAAQLGDSSSLYAQQGQRFLTGASR